MHYCKKNFFLYIHSALMAEKLNIPLLPLGSALHIISSKPEGDVKGNFVVEIHAREGQVQYKT